MLKLLFSTQVVSLSKRLPHGESANRGGTGNEISTVEHALYGKYGNWRLRPLRVLCVLCRTFFRQYGNTLANL